MVLNSVFELQFFAEEKTEPATPRKRRKEREEGRVTKSQDLGASSIILAGLLVMLLFGGWQFNNLVTYMKDIILLMGSESLFQDGWFNLIVDRSLSIYGRILFPFAISCVVAAFFVTVAQVGFFLSSKPLTPKPDRFNPISGLKKVVSLRSLVELVKGLLKALTLAAVLYSVFKSDLDAMVEAIRYSLNEGVSILMWRLWTVSFKMALLLLVIAVFDWAYQKWEFEKSIKMSKQEIKEEYKQMEGDPKIKQKIRQKQREMAQKRMMSEVPNADVVITNPTTLAIAIQYDREKMEAPVLLAKGKDHIARKIREIAEENDIPLVENKPLAWSLYEGVELGEEVPESLYRAVAEVLAFVYKIK